MLPKFHAVCRKKYFYLLRNPETFNWKIQKKKETSYIVINRKNAFPKRLQSEKTSEMYIWVKGDRSGSFTIANEKYKTFKTHISQKIGKNGVDKIAKSELIKILHEKRMKLELGIMAHTRNTSYSVG